MLNKYEIKDQHIIQEVLDRQSTTYFKLTYDYLMNTWERLINHAENGYRMTLDDYTNDLDVRDVLYIIENALTTNGKEEFKKQLLNIDDRYLAATIQVSRPLFRHTRTQPIQYWWYRIPKLASESFMESIKLQGIKIESCDKE